MNGRNYEESFVSRLASCHPDLTYVWEFNLGRRYSRFVATAGVTDESDAATRMRFRVLNGRSEIYERTLAFGQASEINLDVSNVLRLRLEVVDTGEICGNLEGIVHNGAFGTPALT